MKPYPFPKLGCFSAAALAVFSGLLSAAGHEADVVVYGDASGGVTAAVQAARMGKSVVLISQYGHLGGLASSGPGFTDIGNTAILGGLSREFFHAVYQYYQKDESWNFQKRESFPLRAQGTLAFNQENELGAAFKPKVAGNLFVPWSLSASHVAFGSIRVEPVFMVLGQSAGTAASIAIDDELSVQKVPYAKLRKRLIEDGQKLQ